MTRSQLFGYLGKVLDVNLTTGRTKIRKLDEKILKTFVGGSGLGVEFLINEVSPWTDPLGPDNILVFATGPLTGIAPCCARCAAVSRSPLTEGLGETTAGGAWGPALKRSGFDAIIVRGKAEKPVYIWVNDGGCEIRDASNLWGKDTYETTDYIMEELKEKKVSIACIGPAGENLVRFASIVADKGRIWGRLGLGAVMGSKRLKAIALSGEIQIPVANLDKVKEKMVQVVRKVKVVAEKFRKYGTQASVYSLLGINDTPLKYWTKGIWDKRDAFLGDTVLSTYNLRRKACPICPIGCEGVIELPEFNIGPARAPEYETLAAFGPLILNSDIKAIAKANDLCNRLGMDTISTGSVIAFIMECYEKKIISEEKFGRIVKWGDMDRVIELIEEIAYRSTKLGDLLANGSARVAKVLGVENIAVHVKGLDVAMHDPRAAFSSALMYATQPRGGSHTDLTYLIDYGRLTFPEIGIEKPPESVEETVDVVIKMQNISALADALIFCKFGFLGGIMLSDLVEFIKYVTGWDIDFKWVLRTGERLFTIKRLFILKIGMKKEEDKLPERIVSPLPEGPAKGRTPPISEMIDKYYQLRGYDKFGFPSYEKIRELGLEGYC